VQLMNAYGPTECTVITTIQVIDRSQKGTKDIPIGRPLANTKVFILDEDGFEVVPGCIGRLCVSGAGVMRSYIGHSECFVKMQNVNTEGIYVYDTGDLALLNSDGELEYKGRKDSQLKIRGQRTDINEIQAIIKMDPAVKDVIVREVPLPSKTTQLIAYVVIKIPEEKEKVLSSLKSLCKDYLLDFMIPQEFIVLDEFPTNVNHKLDPKLLPLPAQNPHKEEPKDQLEEDLVHLWSEILSLDPQLISTHDNFFLLGGNSLLIGRMIGKLQLKFPSISVRDVFDHQTISQLIGP